MARTSRAQTGQTVFVPVEVVPGPPDLVCEVMPDAAAVGCGPAEPAMLTVDPPRPAFAGGSSPCGRVTWVIRMPPIPAVGGYLAQLQKRVASRPSTWSGAASAEAGLHEPAATWCWSTARIWPTRARSDGGAQNRTGHRCGRWPGYRPCCRVPRRAARSVTYAGPMSGEACTVPRWHRHSATSTCAASGPRVCVEDRCAATARSSLRGTGGIDRLRTAAHPGTGDRRAWMP